MKDVENILKLSKNLKIDQISKLFLGKPYCIEGPLGEGKNGEFDQYPRYRFDKFDCMTFVETVLALSLSKNSDQFIKNIDKIRYKNGEISFIHRNHFLSADWRINNIKEGYIEDITKKIGKDSYKIIEKNIDKPNWYKNLPIERIRGEFSDQDREKKYKKLIEIGGKQGSEVVQLPYIPIEKIENYIDKIISGSIISIVRENIEKYPVIVTHMGFFIKDGDNNYFRHAKYKDKVVDQDFLKYFEIYKDSKWKVIGINILKNI